MKNRSERPAVATRNSSGGDDGVFSFQDYVTGLYATLGPRPELEWYVEPSDPDPEFSGPFVCCDGQSFFFDCELHALRVIRWDYLNARGSGAAIPDYLERTALAAGVDASPEERQELIWISEFEFGGISVKDKSELRAIGYRLIVGGRDEAEAEALGCATEYIDQVMRPIWSDYPEFTCPLASVRAADL